MASAEGVGAQESDRFTLIEAHAAKHIVNVLGALSGVGQFVEVFLAGVAVGRIGAAGREAELGAAHFRDGLGKG